RLAVPMFLFSNSYEHYLLMVSSILHTIEGISESLIFDKYGLSEKDIAAVLDETGTPAGWYPLIQGYEAIPSLPDDLAQLPDEIVALLAGCERRAYPEAELTHVKNKLRSLYKAGSGAKEEGEWTELGDSREDFEEQATAGALIPIPTETFLEELSQKIKIHPISIYRLLKEGIEEHAWRCLPEEKRIQEDRFTVLVLQLLGHRWPVQIEQGEAVPEWADQDGIIPITEGCGEKTLLERIRERIVHEFPADTVAQMVKNAFNFPVKLVEVEKNIYCLELFHGPTLAFKDFGGRFMAECLAQFSQGEKTTILTATSGDTGAAVAHAFYNKPNIDVVILYPKGKISLAQQKLFTTLGNNIHCYAVDGSFDDCQAMVKNAFLDDEVKSRLGLNSANSINISRLVAQVCYYFEAIAQLPKQQRANAHISVPSGNFGNVCAAMIGAVIGLPVAKLSATTNQNDTVPRFMLDKNWAPNAT
ncbi:hypothetical protein LCGC14_2572040, partial [marine sediment metagenome]